MSEKCQLKKYVYIILEDIFEEMHEHFYENMCFLIDEFFQEMVLHSLNSLYLLFYFLFFFAIAEIMHFVTNRGVLN